eukprot:875494-Prymnesium_polylepis.1
MMASQVCARASHRATGARPHPIHVRPKHGERGAGHESRPSPGQTFESRTCFLGLLSRPV